MNNKFILVFCLLCAAGLAGFADDYVTPCRDESRINCRDQGSASTAYNNQDFIQNQQNQLNQRGAYQPAAAPAWQPAYSYLTLPQQSIQVPPPTYNSYAPNVNDLEQQRDIVNTTNQIRLAAVAEKPRDFSNGGSDEDLMEQSRKIKEAAQSEATVNNDNFTDSFTK